MVVFPLVFQLRKAWLPPWQETGAWWDARNTTVTLTSVFALLPSCPGSAGNMICFSYFFNCNIHWGLGLSTRFTPLAASILSLYLCLSTCLIICVFPSISAPAGSSKKETLKYKSPQLKTSISADWHWRVWMLQHIPDVNGNYSPGIHSHCGLCVNKWQPHFTMRVTLFFPFRHFGIIKMCVCVFYLHNLRLSLYFRLRFFSNLCLIDSWMSLWTLASLTSGPSQTQPGGLRVSIWLGWGES